MLVWYPPIYNIEGMTVHLIKLCVGIESLSHLSERQSHRLAEAAAAGEEGVLRHLTRSTPRRRDEVLDGGSIYWVIKGAARVRPHRRRARGGAGPARRVGGGARGLKKAEVKGDEARSWFLSPF